MHGYEVVSGSLQAVGLRTMFGLLGNSNLALAGALTREAAVRFYGSRHESAAVCMAAGHAWATGEPTVCTVTHGPGLSNALTALTSAVRDRLPVVLLVGDIRDSQPWMAQRADHRTMVASTGAEFVDCPESEFLDASVRHAFIRAAESRSPVVLNVPAGVLASEAAPQRPFPPGQAVARGAAHRQPRQQQGATLEEVVTALGAARRPLLLAGRGASWAGAGPALRQLAASTGALMTTSLPARGMFADDQFDIGVCGGYSSRTARRLLAQADLVLAFGASLNGYTTAAGKAFPQARVVHCDSDPEAWGRYTTADLTLHGDARDLALALVAGFQDAGHAPRKSYRTDAVAGLISRAGRGAEYPDGTDADGLDPRIALRAVDDALPDDRQVVIDVGHFSTFPSQVLRVPEGGRFLPAFGFGSVGLALGTAIGAAIGRPVPTVAVVGDGGTLMALGELETLARCQPPVTLIVLNDRAYGAEIHHLRSHGMPEDLADFPACDFAALSADLGLRSHRVTPRSDLSALHEWVSAPGPTVLDVAVTRTVVADRFQTM